MLLRIPSLLMQTPAKPEGSCPPRRRTGNSHTGPLDCGHRKPSCCRSSSHVIPEPPSLSVNPLPRGTEDVRVPDRSTQGCPGPVPVRRDQRTTQGETFPIPTTGSQTDTYPSRYFLLHRHLIRISCRHIPGKFSHVLPTRAPGLRRQARVFRALDKIQAFLLLLAEHRKRLDFTIKRTGHID